MNNSLLSDMRASRAQASFNGLSAYRLEGDLAHLSADVCVEPGTEWALQLWACKPDGISGKPSDNIKIAELPLGFLAYEAIAANGWATALPPAGADAHTMALTLARGEAGVFNEIHDLVSFPHAARFLQPCFTGEAFAQWDENGLSLSTPSVCNPRDEDNLSGTLSIELWALSGAYNGGAFEGQLLASEQIGSLSGQGSESSRTLSVSAAVPSDAVITLMLREWTAVGYVTRDFRQIEQAPALSTPAAPEEASTPAASSTPATTKKAAKAPSKIKAAAKAVGKIAAKKDKADKTVAASTDARTSINAASEDELAAVKGLSRNAAAGIVAGRPYDKLDDVVRAKGMGEKLLARLRAFLRD